LEYLTLREGHRYNVICEVIRGYLKVQEAAEGLRLSERQIYRIKARVEEEGMGAVIHRSRGVSRARRLTQKVKGRIIKLYETKYKGFNLTHMTEFLNEEEAIDVSRESVRQILLEDGCYTRRKKRSKHRQWREPSAREGQMLQFDTSDHDWLEGRGPKVYLVGGVDDATSSVPGARFALSDSCIENMRVLKEIVEKKGIPLSIYCDKDSKFKITRHGGVHYNLKGEYGETQIERALKELGVEIIYANSPQAKGRIERKWGTFQDRLCSELRLHGISTDEGANRYLWEEFLPKNNRQFAHPPREKGYAYRPVPKGVDLDNIFCIKEERTVNSDNTISYKSKRYQILPNAYRISFAKAKVMVHEHIDGSIHIFYKNKELKHRRITRSKNRQKAMAANY
jgi:transposase